MASLMGGSVVPPHPFGKAGNRGKSRTMGKEMSKQRRRRNRSDSKTARGLSTRRGRATQRHLLAERLEDRLLLAADVNPWHNVFVADRR